MTSTWCCYPPRRTFIKQWGYGHRSRAGHLFFSLKGELLDSHSLNQTLADIEVIWQGQNYFFFYRFENENNLFITCTLLLNSKPKHLAVRKYRYLWWPINSLSTESWWDVSSKPCKPIPLYWYSNERRVKLTTKYRLGRRHRNSQLQLQFQPSGDGSHPRPTFWGVGRYIMYHKHFTYIK